MRPSTRPSPCKLGVLLDVATPLAVLSQPFFQSQDLFKACKCRPIYTRPAPRWRPQGSGRRRSGSRRRCKTRRMASTLALSGRPRASWTRAIVLAAATVSGWPLPRTIQANKQANKQINRQISKVEPVDHQQSRTSERVFEASTPKTRQDVYLSVASNQH